MSNLKMNDDKKIYQLPNIKAKYSSKLVSKVVSITFGIIIFIVVAALIVINLVKIDVTIDTVGYLEPAAIKALHSPFSGLVEDVFVKGGSVFNKGDLLLRYNTIKISDQLEKLKRDLEIKRINYEIKKKTIPIEMNQSELLIKKAEAQLLKAKAGLRQKLVDYFPGVNADSFLTTYKKGTHISLDYATAEIITAEAELQSLKSKVDIQAINTMQLQSQLLEIAQIELSINRLLIDLSNSNLTADMNGIVLTDNLERLKGTFVNEGTQLFEISNMDSWKALLNVNEKDVYELKVGDSVKVEIKAMKLAEEFILLPGKVVFISPEPIKSSSSQVISNNFNVEVRLNVDANEKYLSKLRRGFSIDAKIIKQSDKIITVLLKNIKKLL